MNLAEQSQFTSKASQLLSWGHWFTFANIGLALLISFVYLAADSTPDTFLGSVYLIINWLGHIGFLTFICFVLTIFPLSLIFPYPRHIRGMAAILATFGASLLALDAFVYFNLGYHLSSSALPQIMSLTWQTLVQGSWFATFIAGAIVFLILGFELVVSNFCWRHLDRLKQISCGKKITAVFVCCFASSHLLHIWADANLNFDITKQDNVLPLSYPTTARSLLAKNNLLDIDLYQKQRDIKVTNFDNHYQLPTHIPMCRLTSQVKNSSNIDFLIFDSEQALQHYITNQQQTFYPLERFLQPTLSEDTLFNLVYGLPAYYKPSLLNQEIKPAWLNEHIQFTSHGFSQFDFLNSTPTSAHNAKINLVHANEHTTSSADRIFAFSLSNNHVRVVDSSTLYVNDKALRQDNSIIQPMDLITTSLEYYWGCAEVAAATLMGNNLNKEQAENGINYSQGVFIAYKKDRITLIEPDGSFKNISAAQGFALEHKLDVPFLVESIKELKRFSP